MYFGCVLSTSQFKLMGCDYILGKYEHHLLTRQKDWSVLLLALTELPHRSYTSILLC